MKQLFPEKADTWLVVHNLDEMCGYLKKIYSPYNLKQVDQAQATVPTSVAMNAASPFLASSMHPDPYHLRVLVQDHKVHFDDPSLLCDSINNLNNTLRGMNRRPSGNNHDNRNRSSRSPKPYKPYILKGRGRNFGRSCDRDRYCRDDTHPRRSSDSSRGCD